MRRNNVEMKWNYEGQILHGDLIDFVCKQGYELSPSTPPSELSVQCNRGEVKYPSCIRKGKTADIKVNLKTDRSKSTTIMTEPRPNFSLSSQVRRSMIRASL